MAIVSADYLRPTRMHSGGSIPIERWTKGSGTTFAKGTVVVASSGLIIAASDGPGTGTILGVSVEAAASGLTTVGICPILEDVIFEAVTATGDSGATVTVADANLFVNYGLALNSSVWYVNIGDTSSNPVVAIIKRLDADSTAWAKVEMKFVDSFFNII